MYPSLNFDFLSQPFKPNCPVIRSSSEVWLLTVYIVYDLTQYVSYILLDTDTDLRTKMPNPWREKAKGKPVYCIQLRIWQDDVSGNVSKQWNKHWMYCMTLAGIPKKLLAQEYFTRYISCSPHASVLEQASALSDAIRSVFIDPSDPLKR